MDVPLDNNGINMYEFGTLSAWPYFYVQTNVLAILKYVRF